MDEIYYKPILILLIGLIAIFFAKGRNERERKILRNCKEVTGTVIDLEEEYSNGGGKNYFPVVQFDIDNNKAITAKYPDGNYPARYTVRQEITIQYYIDDPTEFLIKGYNAFLFESFTILVGIGLILYSSFLFFNIYFQ